MTEPLTDGLSTVPVDRDVRLNTVLWQIKANRWTRVTSAFFGITLGSLWLAASSPLVFVLPHYGRRTFRLLFEGHPKMSLIVGLLCGLGFVVVERWLTRRNENFWRQLVQTPFRDRWGVIRRPRFLLKTLIIAAPAYLAVGLVALLGITPMPCIMAFLLMIGLVPNAFEKLTLRVLSDLYDAPR